ncbi:NUDIX hydrolase [Frankia sp. QA3]|uniref:NUDIX hydrolase n=1 Tax=Frankia sp. QA3 TaxID=710111 RepID=UPI000269CF06|nr:NUDIX hydrolase [Frankia sp. QA3]EIV95828.1 ADP-ribose pyrophosphatase [Frankia sp. QA3]
MEAPEDQQRDAAGQGEQPGGRTGREIAEETGAVVRPVRLTGVYLNLPLGVVAMVFLCEFAAGPIAAGTAEATEVGWLSPAQIQARFVPAFAVRVTDALAGRGEPFVRTHDGVSVLAADGPG